MIDKKLLCEHLWNHLVVDFRTQEFRMCCKTAPIKTSESDLLNQKDELFLNSNSVLEAREEMLSGQKTKMCQQCWSIEARGLPSHRTDFTDWEKSVQKTNFPDVDLKTADPYSLTQSKYPNNLDIQLGNTCDLKCIYCSDRFSSSWKAENDKFGNMTFEKSRDSYVKNSENHRQLFEISFWSLFEKTKNSYERIAFLGGEPLVSSNFYDILNQLLSMYSEPSKKLEINIITNLNANDFLFKKFLKILPNLSDKFSININISMESWGSKAEFIRNGLVFDRFLNNFKKLLDLKLNIKLTTITSINILCLSTLEIYIRWIRQQEIFYQRDIEVHYNIISYPEFLSLELATQDMVKFIQPIIDFIELGVFHDKNHIPSHWNRYCENLKQVREKILSRRDSTSDQKMTKEFQQFINELQIRRHKNFLDIFSEPEYQRIFKSDSGSPVLG